jgi:hypothetical protein
MRDLDSEQFPMVYSMFTLTGSLTNFMQSAPGCASRFTEDKWRSIEEKLKALPASVFVDIALCRDEDDKLLEQYFPGWREDWE